MRECSCVGERTSEFAEVEPKPRKTTQHIYKKTRDSDDKYAALHRLAAAVKHFSGICGHAVPGPESTVRQSLGMLTMQSLENRFRTLPLHFKFVLSAYWFISAFEYFCRHNL